MTTPPDSVPRVEAAHLDVLREAHVFLLDVREPGEIQQAGTLEGYTNIPFGQLEARLGELPRDLDILTA